MKKYILLVLLGLLSLLFFSCTEKESDISGSYTATFSGRCLYKGNYSPYFEELNITISKKNETEYNIVSYYGVASSSPTQINVYDNNKLKGSFSLPWYATAWSEGTLEGIIRDGDIIGTFTGVSRGVDNITHQTTTCVIEDGVFRMKKLNN